MRSDLETELGGLAMRDIIFTEHDRHALAPYRYHRPEPLVPRKIEVLWLKSHGLGHDQIGVSADVSRRTVQRHLDESLSHYGTGWWLTVNSREGMERHETILRESLALLAIINRQPSARGHQIRGFLMGQTLSISKEACNASVAAGGINRGPP